MKNILNLKSRFLMFFIILSLAACSTAPVFYEGVRVTQGDIQGDFSALSTLSAASPMSAEVKTSTALLAKALLALSPAVSAADANILAQEAHIYPLHLANVWQIAPTPLLHNILRNNAQREFGLCSDWTYAMRLRMRGLGLASFDWHWGIANQGSTLREHSTLVVTAKGAPFATGIALDPWRNSGRLFWARVNADAKYDWQEYFEPVGWEPRRGGLVE